jgi:Zn-dependent protease with chaperone function
MFFGFYLLALGIAAGLLYIPYAEVRYSDHITARLDLFCIVAAGIIVWNILPRLDRFPAPGPQLLRDRHPRLFALLDDVSARSEQAMPAEVFAVPELNAWVAQRGGFMGIGSRRVMGLGLPLMQVLSVDEFRAVIAHEFGHYYGGDTQLGPWIYRTRAAIERTLVAMSRHSSLVTKPFLWYLKLYVRVTHAISRRQEFVADAMAARLAGAGALASGLRTIHSAGLAFGPFWANEMVPVLARGYRPPLLEGFARFLASPSVSTAVEKLFASELAEGSVDPYDTHPPLRERLAALGAVSAAPPAGTPERAISLLGPDLAGLEAEMLGFSAHRVKLRELSWEQAVDAIWAPDWAAVLGDEGHRLRGLGVAELPELGNNAALAVRLKLAASSDVANPGVQQRAAVILGCALALALRGRGYAARADPGEPVEFEVQGIRVLPFNLLESGGPGVLSREQWAEVVAASGIGGLDLSAPLQARESQPA